jgi:hypothetical protein
VFFCTSITFSEAVTILISLDFPYFPIKLPSKDRDLTLAIYQRHAKNSLIARKVLADFDNIIARKIEREEKEKEQEKEV